MAQVVYTQDHLNLQEFQVLLQYFQLLHLQVVVEEKTQIQVLLFQEVLVQVVLVQVLQQQGLVTHLQ